MIIVTDLGADEILKTYFNNLRPVGGNNLTLKLYVNDYTPIDTSIAANFTEASGGGYVSKTLTCGSWTITPGNDPSDAIYAIQNFTFTGPLDGVASIFGYFVIDADGILIYAERAASSFTPINYGDFVAITPKFQASKGTPS